MSESGFRTLLEGEVIQDGDEFDSSSGDGWLPARTYHFGEKWRPGLVPFRRRIETTKPVTRCGCNKHDIDFGADPYAAHRNYLEERNVWIPQLLGSVIAMSYGVVESTINAIKPDTSRALTVLGPDLTGDDIAADAPRRR